jgi:hypothetical protein
MIVQLIAYFLGAFLPVFLFSASILFTLYILYIFVRCIRKTEKLSEAITQREKQYFYLTISYIFTYILI